MGKTGLIRHVHHYYRNNKTIIPVYADIMPTSNLAEFTTTLANATFSALAKNKRLIRSILTGFSSIRPVLSYDPVTGQPAITIKVDNPEDSPHTLDSVFSYLSRQKQHISIALDEFQQIAIYPERYMEATLRTMIQPLNNVSFIFSGSKKHILSDIFSSPGRPFFNSTEIMEIGTIDTDDYYKFITGHFNTHKIKIDRKALDLLKEYTSMHTFYVQFLCNRLFSAGLKTIGEKEVIIMYRQVLSENEPVYASFINLITPFQFRLLRAIAKKEGATGLTSKKFLQENNLGAASSVNTAIKALVEKDFIYREENRYYLVDRFFSGWIAQNGNSSGTK